MHRALRIAAPIALLLLPLAVLLAGAAPDPSAPDPAVSTPVGEGSPPTDDLLAGDEQAIARSGCTAAVNCPCHPATVSCSGTTSCIVGSNYVICDGNQTNCPSPNIPAGCADPVGWCACRDAGGPRPTCTDLYC